MFLSDISIKRPIMMTMALMVFVVFGALAYFGLTLDMMPDVDIPVVTVRTVYPGGNPEEIETQVSKKIEDAVSTINKIDFVRSFSLPNVSLVQIQFDLDKDVDIANQEVKDKVDAILNDLPTDAEQPIIEKFDIGAKPVVEVVLSGSMPLTELYEYADKKISDRFAQISGVAKVNVSGGQEREIRVELDNRTVFSNQISLKQLNDIFSASNMNIPGGNFQKKNQDYSVKFEGKFETVEEIQNFEIPTAFGKKKLGTLATIIDGGKDIRERSVYFNNLTKKRDENIVLLSMVKSSSGNTVEIAESIIKSIPEIEKTLPDGMRLNIIKDGSIFIKASVEDTLTNIGLGIVLTSLVLLFFLHDVRSTFIVALSMPMSIVSTFMLIKTAGYNLNIMTLMGLSTSVGILVANSVVVIENIFRYREMGKNKKEAAGRGTAEVVVAVLASTLTNLVVFLPIASMSSMVGQFFKEFAMTVSFATVFSLIMSFTLTPMLASLILPEKVLNKKNPIGDLLEGIFSVWEKAYKKTLELILKNKWISSAAVLVSIGAFFLSTIFWGANIGFEFVPLTDEGDIEIQIELPQGYNIDETGKFVTTVEEHLKEMPEVKHMVTTLGKISDMDVATSVAKMDVKLIDVEKRPYSGEYYANEMVKRLSKISNGKIRIAAISSAGGSGDAPYMFFLQGQDMTKLEEYKDVLVEKLAQVPGLINLNTSSKFGRPEITIKPKRDKLANLGLTAAQVGFAARAGIEGLEASTFSEKGEEYDIRITLKDISVDTPEKIGNIAVATEAGVFRLSQLADVKFTLGNSKILHEDKIKSIQFTGYAAAGAPLGDLVNATNVIIEELDMPIGYTHKWGGTVTMMNDAMSDMGVTFLIAMLLTYMLLAAILESFVQPMMILGTIPLAMIGVFGALYFTGSTMNIMSMMAIIMLIGIVVNNAILILDYTNILRGQGMKVKEALIEAAPTRLKPILMSTIAIILGMLPMAIGIGSAGREFRQPLGIVSIGGLIVSTILTLYIIPAIYQVVTKDKKVAGGE